MKSIRVAFEEAFGNEDAAAIMAAAEEHQNGVHDKRGSDPFKWAILICIGFECVSKGSYRKHHGIKTPWRDLKRWIKAHADLGSHDGDCDYLALMSGVYNEYAAKD
ncbi:hypothetical protein LCGC14_2956160 [marine sediment metagenome]|uniref:Uncharacterized protein n=1 Tax=marine sediment metagenome TaxID=412755 RepID=A0A0F8Y0Y2_9ZZZZ